MYAYISGQLVACEDQAVIVDYQGIGYRLLTAGSLVFEFQRMAPEVKAYTSLVVREQSFELYGFPTLAQRQFFELLQTVSGVGPKLACSILGQMSLDQFAIAVLNADYKTLTSLKGLGKKGAERLVLELKDKLKELAPSPSMVAPLQAEDGELEELKTALLVLGYSQAQADASLEMSYVRGLSLEENLRAALKQLAI